METDGEDPCEFPRHTAGFPSRRGMRQTDLDYYQVGTFRHKGTAMLERAPTVECPYDSVPLPSTTTDTAHRSSAVVLYRAQFTKKS